MVPLHLFPGATLRNTTVSGTKLWLALVSEHNLHLFIAPRLDLRADLEHGFSGVEQYQYAPRHSLGCVIGLSLL